jgi:hypothetical protein
VASATVANQQSGLIERQGKGGVQNALDGLDPLPSLRRSTLLQQGAIDLVVAT